MQHEITTDEFNALVRPLLSMPVSLPWKGYGSAIFLELGELSMPQERRRHEEGEACVTIRWDWRIESGIEVLCGSSNSGPEIETGIRLLREARVEEISVSGAVRELALSFSRGQCLKSMVMVSGEPQWSIRLGKEKWIFSEKGRLYFGDGAPSPLTEAEAAACDFAEVTTQRWGELVAEPKLGDCRDCQWYVRLDGDAYFLDYGVCAQSGSPFDGRVVHCESGCPAFSGK
jgi:hypothetical protein